VKRLSALLFVAVLLVAGLALLPLRAAIDALGLQDTGLTAAGVEGTIWSGRLTGAAIRGVPLGEIRTRARPLPLLTGTTRIAFEATGGSAAGSGELLRAGQVTGVEAVDASLPLALFRTALPLDGTLKLEQFTVHFRDGRCVLARGRMSTDALQRSPALMRSAGTLLSGPARCEGGALVFPLHGAAPTGEVALTLTLAADGGYRTDIRVDSRDPALRAGLSLAGFAAAGNGQTRTEQGRWLR
jgi:general secretion pathway protein N